MQEDIAGTVELGMLAELMTIKSRWREESATMQSA